MCEVSPPGDEVVGPGEPHLGQPEHGLVVPLVEVKGRHVLHSLTLP